MCIYEPPVYVYFSVLLCWFAFFPPNCDAVKPAAGKKKKKKSVCFCIESEDRKVCSGFLFYFVFFPK